MRNSVTKLFEALIKMGVKTSREGYVALNVNKVMEMDLTDSQVAQINTKFKKFFTATNSQISMV